MITCLLNHYHFNGLDQLWNCVNIVSKELLKIIMELCIYVNNREKFVYPLRKKKKKTFKWFSFFKGR